MHMEGATSTMNHSTTKLFYNCVKKTLLFSGALLLFSSCEQRIDASSKDSAKESIEKICQTLTASESETFRANCLIIAIDGEGFNSDSYKKLDGKTVAEVNAMAEAVTQRRKAEREQKAKEEEAKRKNQEISELTEKIATLKEQEALHAHHAECRSKIVVSGVTFRKQKDMFDERPVVAFTIQNKSEQALSSITMDAVLTSTGRSVPWVTDTFRYAFPGGLNPGEEQKLELSPNRFSDWGRMENRPDYHLKLTLKEAEDETGTTIWETYDTATEERAACEARLRELQGGF